MALRKMFPRLRAGEWSDRIDALRAKLVKDADGLARLLRHGSEIAERIKAEGEGRPERRDPAQRLDRARDTD